MSLLRPLLFSVYKKSVHHLSRYGLSRFSTVRSVNNLLISRLKPEFVEIQGFKLFLDSNDSQRFSTKEAYEPFETELLKKLIHKGEVVLDIGANIGYYTLLFAGLVGQEGKVYAFEPYPANFSLLKRNIRANGFPGVTAVPRAVSRQTGEGRLYLSRVNHGDHRLYDSGDGRKSIEVETVALDDFFKDSEEKIDWIKMDIQGAEGGAIQGMPLLLQRNETLKIVTEFWPFGLQHFGTDPQRYLQLLREHGFHLWNIDEEKMKLEPVSIPQLLEVYGPPAKFTNLLCLRGS